MNDNFVFTLNKALISTQANLTHHKNANEAVLSSNKAQDLEDSAQQVIQHCETDIKSHACVIIDIESVDFAYALLCRIRKHTDPSIYLTHVLMLSDDNTSETNINNHCFDTVISKQESLNNKLATLESRILATQQWILSLPNSELEQQDTSLRFKILRFLVSRQLTIKPIKTIQAKGGYVFAKLRAFTGEDDLSIENVLEFLEQQQLLTSTFIEKAHFCGHCGSAFLNFKEICPDCHSGDITSKQMVHHFHCGHVGTVDSFKQGNKLVCPKCDRELKHIGVDYDKPSSVYVCNSCSLNFQEPYVQAQCFSCTKTSDIENLDLRELRAYETTSIGSNAAIYGLDALFTQILQTDLQLYSQEEIKHYIKIEKARILRYKKSQSTLCCIYFSNLDLLYSNLGKKTQQLFKELSAVFKSVFRESDLITARNESVFVIVMTETNLSGANKAMQRLQDAILNLFKDSMNFDIAVQVGEFNIIEVDDVDSTIETFLSNEG